MLGNLVVFFSAVFAVLSKDTIDPAVAGLSVTYALPVRSFLVLLRHKCVYNSGRIVIIQFWSLSFNLNTCTG